MYTQGVYHDGSLSYTIRYTRRITMVYDGIPWRLPRLYDSLYSAYYYGIYTLWYTLLSIPDIYEAVYAIAYMVSIRRLYEGVLLESITSYNQGIT